MAPPDRDAIAALLQTLAVARGVGKTFCPSEAARALSPDWRPLMPQIRTVAADLAERGALVATQKGDVVDPVAARGPIRLGLPKDTSGS